MWEQMLTSSEQPCFYSQCFHNSKAIIQVSVSAWHRSLTDSIFSWHLDMASWWKCKGITHSVNVSMWKLFLLLLCLFPHLHLLFLWLSGARCQGRYVYLFWKRVRSVEEHWHMNPCENAMALHAGQLSSTTGCSLTLQILQRSLTGSFLAVLAVEFVVCSEDEL